MPDARLTIPTIRDELHAMADRLGPMIPTMSERLHFLADETRRRKPTFKRAPARLKRLTDEQAAHIRWLKSAHPTMSLREIAEKVGSNSGRVSEVLSGKRDGG